MSQEPTKCDDCGMIHQGGCGIVLLCFNQRCEKTYTAREEDGRTSTNRPFYSCPMCGYPNTR